MSRFKKKLLEGWESHNWLSRLMLPLSVVYRGVNGIRAGMYKKGLLKSEVLPVPVIIVGNLTVGGTGKTPLVIYVVDYLRRAGLKPGVISRGYGGNAETWPQEVSSDSDPKVVGDEPVLLASRCVCPVVVGPARGDDARLLLEKHDVDIVVSDDGLQHYALQRQIEIVLVTAHSDHSNVSLLPAGPWRESPGRLATADLVVTRGYGDGEMRLRLGQPVRVDGSGGDFEYDGAVHVVAGIARPASFFKPLRESGLTVIEHPFSDHYNFQYEDIHFNDKLPVLMTEKDAVKCRKFAGPEHWFVPATAEPGSAFDGRLMALLTEQGILKGN
jgi:tetraacyldisaccharide 4'-kinase